jgi:Domain of unknown function (DUF4390)
MMASFMLYCIKHMRDLLWNELTVACELPAIGRYGPAAWLSACLVMLFLCFPPQPVSAQTLSGLPADLQLSRLDDQLVLSAQVPLELSPAVEDAVKKGVAIYFVEEVEISKDRWYWYDKIVMQQSRHYRLAYQPLTRKWRVVVSAESNFLNEPGMALSQTFERLPDALAFVGRVSAWRLGPLSDLEGELRYTLNFRLRLDTSALPRPLQIGLIGQSDWNVAASKSMRFTVDAIK